MKFKNIAGVVTLYNPDDNVCENIKTYAEQLGELYVVLNSKVDIKITDELVNIGNIVIIKQEDNIGIARAINIVLEKVYGRYDWCLTMDQDSYFYEGNIEKYLSLCANVNKNLIYGICNMIDVLNCKQDETNELVEIDSYITSGMLLNIELATKCGGMDEKLFIDEVDFEFCYRCNNQGYKLLLYKKNIMYHCVGQSRIHSIGGVKFISDHEPFVRVYYIYRNSLYVMNKYPYVRKKYIVQLCKRFIKMILVEDEKIKKLQYMIMGIRDYHRRHMGKLI